MICQFCSKNKATEVLTDGETQKEINICLECEEMMYFKIPNKVKKIKGYKDLTIQQLEEKIDIQIENDIQYAKYGI